MACDLRPASVEDGLPLGRGRRVRRRLRLRPPHAPHRRGEWLADGFTTLGAIAAVTNRIELGTLVASGTMHSPVSLARRAGTVQDVPGGRMVLGLDQVWTGATEWTGPARSFSGLQTLPLPDGAEPPFLLLAAHGPRAIALAARHGDGWNSYGGPDSVQLEPEDYWRSVRASPGASSGPRRACTPRCWRGVRPDVAVPHQGDRLISCILTSR